MLLFKKGIPALLFTSSAKRYCYVFIYCGRIGWGFCSLGAEIKRMNYLGPIFGLEQWVVFAMVNLALKLQALQMV